MRQPSARVRDRNALRKLIKASGMTYAQLASATGCHLSMIEQLVNGHRSGLADERAVRLAEALEVAPDVLFVRFVEAPPSNGAGGSEAVAS